MIGTSVPEYIFIRISTFALRAITPLSVFYVAFSIADPPSSSLRKAALAWATVEAGFYLLVFFPRKRQLQSPAQHPLPLDREERQELWSKCAGNIPEPEAYLSKWFLGAKAQEIARGNVREWLRWAMFGKGDADGKLAEEDEEELEGYVDGVEVVMGRKLDAGMGSAKSLRLTVDEVKMLHRPFLWYMIVGLVDTLTAGYLWYNGFKLHRTPMRQWLGVFPWRLCCLFTSRISPASNLNYWSRPHTSKTRLPVLFIHGISMGLYSYAQFLAEITKHDPLGPEDGEIGIIAIEILPISFRITSPVLAKQEMVRQISDIIHAHGWDKFVLASHSYGSVITTHLLQTPHVARMIGPVVFIDPVTFMLQLPDVAYNFTARPPRGANEHQLYYFASTDMMVAHTLARNFFWSENILWKEDVAGRDVTVSLGGRDLIVDTEIVGKYLAGVGWESEDQEWKKRDWTGSGLDLLWFPTCDHAQVFERKEGRKRLGDVVRAYAERREVGDELP
ncbi:uncharacterized protein BDR25DRAFT_307972 [Lindgomyces ingoldianus]|uniref:Uncharacterized protein n=1 Tax=Lindgomyces ingoldianus TaxID=673940 RepID=A0ACB6QA91_9PLEO|nr:uncharacterized protein BDR25DRAFT_307972 [Lindgomyces ingoldianus]KAF2463070.1 hypothetical protein BDR25DRAFT_307972 [Lindgomyces ingoldianus]